MANRIAEARRAEGLTQIQLANALARRIHRKVDQKSISNYERGKTAVPDDTKLALAKILRRPVISLMGWDKA